MVCRYDPLDINILAFPVRGLDWQAGQACKVASYVMLEGISTHPCRSILGSGVSYMSATTDRQG
jgi:hypothetical protein